MSKLRYTLAQAASVANLVVAQLAPWCERIEIVGSIRRQKAFVGDVEVLFIPKRVPKQADLLGGSSEMEDIAALRADELVRNGWLKKRPSETGVFTWGELNKLAIHAASGIPVDLFCEPDPSNWFRSLVIRTGPKELNIRLIEGAAKRGVRMHAYGTGFTKTISGETVPCNSEQDVFRIAGVKYLTPTERTTP